jgi:hypothetical protein
LLDDEKHEKVCCLTVEKGIGITALELALGGELVLKQQLESRVY